MTRPCQRGGVGRERQSVIGWRDQVVGVQRLMKGWIQWLRTWAEQVGWVWTEDASWDVGFHEIALGQWREVVELLG